MVPLFGAAYAAPKFYTDVGLHRKLNPPVNGKIKGLGASNEHPNKCFHVQ